MQLGLRVAGYALRGMIDAGCWVLDAGYWTLDVGRWILDDGYLMLYS